MFDNIKVEARMILDLLDTYDSHMEVAALLTASGQLFDIHELLVKHNTHPVIKDILSDNVAEVLFHKPFDECTLEEALEGVESAIGDATEKSWRALMKFMFKTKAVITKLTEKMMDDNDEKFKLDVEDNVWGKLNFGVKFETHDIEGTTKDLKFIGEVQAAIKKQSDVLSKWFDALAGIDASEEDLSGAVDKLKSIFKGVSAGKTSFKNTPEAGEGFIFANINLKPATTEDVIQYLDPVEKILHDFGFDSIESIREALAELVKKEKEVKDLYGSMDVCVKGSEKVLKQFKFSELKSGKSTMALQNHINTAAALIMGIGKTSTALITVLLKKSDNYSDFHKAIVAKAATVKKQVKKKK